MDFRCSFSCLHRVSSFVRYSTQLCILCSVLPIIPTKEHYGHLNIIVGHWSWCANNFSYGKTSWHPFSKWQHLNWILHSRFLVILFTRSNWLLFLQYGHVFGFYWNQCVLQSPHNGFSHVLHSIGFLRTLSHIPQISSGKNASTCAVLNILSSSKMYFWFYFVCSIRLSMLFSMIFFIKKTFFIILIIK